MVRLVSESKEELINSVILKIEELKLKINNLQGSTEDKKEFIKMLLGLVASQNSNN
jgi:chaperonin cofactor prefoldin